MSCFLKAASIAVEAPPVLSATSNVRIKLPRLSLPVCYFQLHSRLLPCRARVECFIDNTARLTVLGYRFLLVEAVNNKICMKQE